MVTGEPIRLFRETKRLLTGIYCPKEVAVMHKKRAQQGRNVEQEQSQYTEEELERYEKRGAKITDKG